ncbi:hypothetical protein [Rhodococcus sp. NPDC004095]
MAQQDDARFGEKPLGQTMAAAAAMRRMTGLLLALERDHPAVDEMLARLAEWERAIAPSAPRDPAPRIGPNPDPGRRVYLDHAFDIGAFNPSFPEYRFDRIEADSASGTVCFPVPYEGPPGLVHGGFLGVFFDCVAQHHNCAVRASGKTRSMNIRYRRPTPLLTDLAFDIARQPTERGVLSTVRLLHGDELLCTGEVDAVALSPDKLAGFRFDGRRADGGAP